MKDGVVAYAVRKDGDVTVPYPGSMGTGSRAVAELAVHMNGGEVVPLVVQPEPMASGSLLHEFKRAWNEADKRGEIGSRSAAGLIAVIEMIQLNAEKAAIEGILSDLKKRVDQ